MLKKENQAVPDSGVLEVSRGGGEQRDNVCLGEEKSVVSLVSFFLPFPFFMRFL